jgi:signal transduction histidine kinase
MPGVPTAKIGGMPRDVSRSPLERAFEIAVVLPTVVLLGWFAAADVATLPTEELVQIVVWLAITAIVELIPVPVWRGTHIGMGFPLLMVVAFLYPAAAAGATAFVAASDPREIRREINALRALFNRSQIGLAVWGASAVFHTFAVVETSRVPLLLGAALVAAIVDYCVNFGITSVVASLHYRMSPFRVIRQLTIGGATEFVVSYLGLAVFGLILAKIFVQVDFLAVPVILIPLLLARQMFFRSKALEEAHAELQDREQVLRALSNRMAEERQDERQQIAAYLHDDLAQLLFRLSIQVDVARRHLSSGKIDETEGMLAEIKETKNRTSDRIRALIRDLHRSPLGRAGLAEALQGFIAEAGRESDVRFHTDVDEVELPAPIALLLYHIAREGVMNALKHAEARNLWVSVKPDGDEVTMVLRDDGVGYDTSAPEPEGHFGLTMMRERATVGGGSYTVASTPGEGTTITVRFPTSWLQEATDRDARESVPAGDRDGAAPGIPARSSSTAGSVPA